MDIANDVKHLNICLTKIRDLIKKSPQKLRDIKKQPQIQPQNDITGDNLLRDSQLNNNVFTFTLNNNETQVLDTVTWDIQTILDQYMPCLSQRCFNQLLDFLHTYHYDREKKEFTSSLSRSKLHSFRCELKDLLASTVGFPAASDGNLSIVKDFIKKYPSYKDKSGLWETTLLYSAARNNHLDIVRYLIEKAHCSINAQNQREVVFTINTPNKNITPRPIAGSTALHGACYHNHLNIVKYLVEHGADYFIENQARETALKNGEQHVNIKKFFLDYLVLSYINDKSEDFPDRLVVDDIRRPVRDCIWEYKPFQDPKWYKFSPYEEGELQKPLSPTEQFQQQVYLKLTKGLYTVSMIEFYRSGRHELDPQKNMAWVRCRGSSILNFDCYSIWQIMFIQYNRLNTDLESIPSLKIQRLPTAFIKHFQIHFNTWYGCDTKISSLLDNSMNCRRKIVSIDIPFIGDGLKFNLQTFEFSNNEKKILGYIRWIPKLIANNGNNDKKIVHINNYHPMVDMQPIPLTTKHLKEVLQIKYGNQREKDSSLPIEMPTETSTDYDNTDDVDSSNNKKESNCNNNGSFSITGRDIKIRGSRFLTRPLAATTSNISSEQFFNDQDAESKQSPLIERANTALKIEATDALKLKLEADIKNLNDEIFKVEQQKQSGEKLTKEKEQEFKKVLEDLQQQLHSKQSKEGKITELSKQIKVIDYINIEPIFAINFLSVKTKQIIDYLKTKYQIDNYFLGILSLTITENNNNNTCCISVTGVQIHHDEFKLVLQRLLKLSNVTQSAKDYYQRQLNATRELIDCIMTEEIPSSYDWENYTKYFQELVQQKIEKFVKLFYEYIMRESKSMIEKSITDARFQSWIEVHKLTNKYMQEKPFTIQLEELKHEALEEYIKQHISLQQLKLDRKPTEKSLKIMNDFIDKVKREFKTNKIYNGCDIDRLKKIPKLLQKIMLYYRCFLLQLPLFESSKELLDIIEKNTVTTIATSTGSGKSSLLPVLLIAEGYEKVIVTQPRRLPCTAICQRVNDTMITNKDDFKLAGWAVSGAERDVDASILYLTDGLLKERLLNNENLITTETINDKPIVFFIDEVHERSLNIDLCLALIARLLTEKSQFKSNVKIIISSATLDTSVPTLFRQIPQLKVDEFKMPMLGTLYPVTTFERPDENILELVQELCKKRERLDQILCFVNSVSEVHQCCRLLEEISRGTIIAFPLVQSQSANDQQTNIEQGSIFFSTTVAETSLTFPSLKYVIDTGMINIPFYDFNKKQTILMEVRASESSIKQRLGRLGRTKSGEYYSLYDFKVEDKKYPTPQICQLELTNVELSLRRSIIKNGLNYMKKYLADSPTAQAIDGAVEELRRFRILDSHDKLTSVGVSISKLPDFGSLAMSKSVLSALNQNNCGRDLIVLSSILSVLNTSLVFKEIPASMKSSEGDFMSLLNVMNEILVERESTRIGQFDLAEVCQAKGLTPIQHVLKQALRRYINLEKLFNVSEEYREKAQVASNDWELIAKSLLNGYSENVFVSMKELQGKSHLFTRYSPPKEDIAVLDLQSTLTRSISSAPVLLVLARDIRFSSSIRATAILSFVGEIKSQWIDYRFQRKITLNEAEEAKLNSDSILAAVKQNFSNIKFELNNHIIIIEGPAGSVLDAELDILQQLIVELKFSLSNQFLETEISGYERMKRNLESVSKKIRIFNPMIWRWEAQHQVKITVDNSTTKDECEILIQGRDSQNQLVQKEFQSFLRWLKDCAVIRHPRSGVSPRILKPQIRHNCLNIEEKISHITDSKRTSIELWNALKGSKATRETRMEVVAWIAVCKFDCRLEGGFIRDWIVGNYTARPAGTSSTWISYMSPAGVSIPYLNKDLIPSDLDCHLAPHKYFDIDKFLDNLHKYQIECKVFREDWRYILLLDENTKTGPFTMDLIEPHVALTHDQIDFDVSNLSLEKDYTKELGMRVDIQQRPYLIDLEIIVDNIKNKRFQVLRPIDGIIRGRIEKMKSRGWTQLEEALHIIPNPSPKYHVVLVPLPASTELYKSLVQQMKTFIGNQAQVLSIEQIKNPLLEEAYLSMKQLIAKQCVGQNPNERELFHGTRGEAIDGILDYGFDDRYWRKGKWGHGAYFADNPSVSHGFTEPNPTDQTRIMYYNKVTLGSESISQILNQELMSAPKGHHSLHGQFATNPNSDEYIVYRYGQALPYLKITYKT